MHLIIHDVDRDGLGAAAMLVYKLGVDVCELEPLKEKNLQSYFTSNKFEKYEKIWVLDIPSPRNWSYLAEIPKPVIWVDHHPLNPKARIPENVTFYHPKSALDHTTTMHLLRDNNLVELEATSWLWKALCVPSLENDWALVFSGIDSLWPNVPFSKERLPSILFEAIRNKVIPDILIDMKNECLRVKENVSEIVTAGTKVQGKLAVLYLPDADGIGLKNYSLEIGKQNPDKIAVIVHRNKLLYCGIRSKIIKFDLLEHFKSRGLEPKGHPYVCFADLGKHNAQEEIEKLAEAVK